jgi:hypothetical protein
MLTREDSTVNVPPAALDALAARMIAVLRERGAKCLLCNAPPTVAGVWLPRPELGGPPLWYALCQDCYRRRDAAQAAEAALTAAVERSREIA